MVMLILLVIVLGILAYAWIAYPLVMTMVLRLCDRRLDKEVGPASAELPSVCILFSAHNEEETIQARLENLAALDYPVDLVRVLVGVDGGTDRTAEIAQEWARSHPHVQVVVSQENRGKTAMLKLLVGMTSDRRHEPTGCSLQPERFRGQAHPSPQSSSLLVLTDANTLFAPDALRHLAAPFVDPKVGGVCGRLVFLDAADGMETRENLYWRAETVMKSAESLMDSCLGANGAIYAIRTDLFWLDVPDNTIVDDFVIGMKIREKGLRMVYEAAAVATEPTPARISEEWRRRVRIGAGAFQALMYCRSCLSPRYGVFAICFWSHKVLRWFTPHLLGVLAGAALLCLWWGSGVVMAAGGLVLLAGAAFVALAVAGRLAGTGSPLKAFDYFLSMQAALFAGFIRFCRGGLSGAWERTGR